jgi:hypothetical protein
VTYGLASVNLLGVSFRYMEEFNTMPKLLVLLLPVLASAQSVVLGGTAANPTIINHTGRRILAYTLMIDGYASITNLMGELRNRPLASVGIGPGETFLHNSLHRPQMNRKPVKITVDAVVFDNGYVAGPDKSGTFEQLSAQIKAEHDVHRVLVHGQDASDWTRIQSMADGQFPDPEGSSRYRYRYRLTMKLHADELLRVRSRSGDAAALKLAHSSETLPTLVKGQ